MTFDQLYGELSEKHSLMECKGEEERRVLKDHLNGIWDTLHLSERWLVPRECLEPDAVPTYQNLVGMLGRMLLGDDWGREIET